MRRLAFVLLAAGTSALAVLSACSGDDDATPSVRADASGDSTTAPDVAAPGDGGAQDAGPVGDGAPACTPATMASDPPTDLCAPIGQCNACATPGHVRYLCQSKPYGAPTTLVGDASVLLPSCVRILRSEAFHTAEYCCPSSWVRHREIVTELASCAAPGTPSLYVAPLGSEATLPAGCELVPNSDGGTMLRGCCPNAPLADSGT